MNAQGIKTMKLYHQVERVFRELAELGISEADPIPIEALVASDQWHYRGTESVDEAIGALGLDAKKHVIEVGAGIGGPARYLADRAGCRVTAVELQAELNEIAQTLTRRCGLADQVTHVCGDFLEGAGCVRTFDALLSWLTFLHIPDRDTLYRRCFEALEPGAPLFVEDYFERSPLSIEEREALEREVYCAYVPRLADYAEQLERAGFCDIELTDMTGAWVPFVTERRDGFRRARERNLRVHGAEIVDELEEFYATIVSLFGGGNLGGIRVIARKP